MSTRRRRLLALGLRGAAAGLVPAVAAAASGSGSGAESGGAYSVTGPGRFAPAAPPARTPNPTRTPARPPRPTRPPRRPREDD